MGSVSPIFLGFLRLADTEHRVAIMRSAIDWGVADAAFVACKKALTGKSRGST